MQNCAILCLTYAKLMETQTSGMNYCATVQKVDFTTTQLEYYLCCDVIVT